MFHGYSRPIFLLITLLYAFPVWAQQPATDELSGSIAEYRRIPDQEVAPGSIVSFDNEQYQLATEPYTTTLFGVHSANPAVAVSHVGRAGAYPIATGGTAQVRVTNQNGPIEAGDFVTSSTVPGVGMLATETGYVIGQALADYDSNEEGLIAVSINIHNSAPAGQGGGSLFSRATDVARAAAAAEPSTALRFLIAALVLIASILFGFLLFGRSATNGLIAVGRNPLAKRAIYTMMAFNISMTIGFTAAGLVLAIVILAI